MSQTFKKTVNFSIANRKNIAIKYVDDPVVLSKTGTKLLTGENGRNWRSTLTRYGRCGSLPILGKQCN